MALSEKDADFWAGRLFDQHLATEQRRRFIASLGHPPLKIAPKAEAAQVEDPEPDIEETPWAEATEGLPRSLVLMQKRAGARGYSTRAYLRHGARRGHKGKLKDPPEGDYALLAAVRGEERFTAMWGEANGKWTFAEGLDYTPRDGIIPAVVKSTHINKERLA